MNRQIEAILKEDKPLLFGVRSAMALQSERIFLKGLNADNGIIGDYIKPRPLYVSEKYRNKTNLPKFPLVGKTGEAKFKNGKNHKSGYFGNWLEFKHQIGRNKNIQTVDLFLTGTLHRHWANSNVVGRAEARKVNQHNYNVAISDEDVKKVDRYNRVFNLSAKEKELFLKTVNFELMRALK